MKQINIFIEIVIYVSVDCKSDSRQGEPKFLQISKGRKSETAMVRKNKKQKYPVDTTCHNLSRLLLRLKFLLEKVVISAGPK